MTNIKKITTNEKIILMVYSAILSFYLIILLLSAIFFKNIIIVYMYVIISLFIGLVLSFLKDGKFNNIMIYSNIILSIIPVIGICTSAYSYFKYLKNNLKKYIILSLMGLTISCVSFTIGLKLDLGNINIFASKYPDIFKSFLISSILFGYVFYKITIKYINKN